MELEIDRGILAQVVLMGRELDRAEPELRPVIERLGRDEQAELVAIMWIGRGAFDASEWAEARATAEAEATTPCADYVLGTPHFTDHIESGLDALGISIRDDEEALLR
ncbi:DUF3775 domain-containing protein [uncultured Tateyamaria sp.]|uniref:DUF3775 domain-containing protein n=1 Tax=uncultured Tateyamaria sp. TaxID=455651 RepID=UPI0026065F0E|nr:DUF3775 domain-containing protein [uncultured Tateyamaria sp.]